MGLVKTRRLAAMQKQQRVIHLRQGYGELRAGMWKSVRKDVSRSLSSSPGKNGGHGR